MNVRVIPVNLRYMNVRVIPVNLRYMKVRVFPYKSALHECTSIHHEFPQVIMKVLTGYFLHNHV